MGSFTSADAFPDKLFLQGDVLNGLRKKLVIPIHAGLSLTDRCNKACSFCSCKNLSRKDELGIQDITNICNIFSSLGIKAVDLTGGGEPLMHPDIVHTITLLDTLGIDIGLVTNGFLLSTIPTNILNKLTWCRISASDEVSYDEFTTAIMPVVTQVDIDWGLSFVVSDSINMDNLLSFCSLLQTEKFTHIRIVKDIFKPTSGVSMEYIKGIIEHEFSGLNIVYQDRIKYTKGSEKCFCSILKPLVASDGYIYPCCGVQYAKEEYAYSFDNSMRMGYYTDLEDIVKKQDFFDGSSCFRCYYNSYNEAIGIFLGESVKHVNFV